MNSAERLSKILSSRNLTLNGVSRRSLELYGRSSRFFVPHNLHYEIELRGRTPTIQQLMTLSLITNYRLSDWLAAFGFDVEALWRLPFLLRRSTTSLLTSEIFDPSMRIAWFTDRFQSVRLPDIAPLGELVAPFVGVPAAILSGAKGRFLYAKIGESDPYAVSSFSAGSIVRANAKHPSLAQITAGTLSESADFFLTEYDRGWTCSRLVLLGGGRVALRCPFEGFLERELRLGRNAKILGLIDAEIRPVTSLGHKPTSQIPSSISPEPRQSLSVRSNIGGLLRNLRIKLGLSFREASSMSRQIAAHLGDEKYFAAAGTLSDFETLASAPRHVEKILTLCALYCIGLEEFLRACNLPVDRTGQESIPDDLLSHQTPQEQQHFKRALLQHTDSANGFVNELCERWEEIPFFLKGSLDSITGIKNFSHRDAFWVGGDPQPRHPLLLNAEFVAVNRRARKPPSPNKAGCQPPLYVLLRRDGSYLCGPCTLDDTHLSLGGGRQDAIAPERFRNVVEAEVIGQVTAIARRIGC
jgi:hypothetical protein